MNGRNFVMLASIGLLLCEQVLATVWYVDKDNLSGTENGQSWATAYKEIRPAVIAASGVGGGEVWVAEGVYDEARPNANGSLELVSNVHLYGGFKGTETDLAERAPQTQLTVIDGSKARAGNAALHVVIGANDATLDGFIVRGGKAYQTSGGGMINIGVSPTVSNCTFMTNTASPGWTGGTNSGGGGMYNTDSAAPNISSCRFVDNRADSEMGYGCGGGMANYHSNPIVTDCVFENNVATAWGGGVNNAGASPMFRRCVFQNNEAKDSGGGMANGYFQGTSTPSLSESQFIANTSGYWGGGMYNQLASPVVINCLFLSNHSVDAGGGVCNRASSSAYRNCTLYGNMSETAGGALYNDDASPSVVNSILWGNAPFELDGPIISVTYSAIKNGYPGIGNTSSNPSFRDGETGDFHLLPGSPCIDRGDNAAVPDGTLIDLDGHPRFVDDPNTVDTGAGAPPIVDMGAYEYAPGLAMTLVSAESTREHTAAGRFGVPVPLDNAGTEPRQAGSAPAVVLTFSSLPTAGGATPICSNVIVTNATCSNVSVSGNDMVVSLSGLTKNICLTLTLLGIDGLMGDTDVSVILHEGNVNGDGSVNLSDLQAIKNRLLQPVAAANYSLDVNADGSINLADLQATKNNLLVPAVCP